MLSGFLPTGIQTHAHTHTRIKPSKCVWSMPTQPDSRIYIISCSADLIDCRIKWSVKESFMSFFCFLFSTAHTQSFSGIHLQGEGFVLGCVSLWSWFWSWNSEQVHVQCAHWFQLCIVLFFTLCLLEGDIHLLNTQLLRNSQQYILCRIVNLFTTVIVSHLFHFAVMDRGSSTPYKTMCLFFWYEMPPHFAFRNAYILTW